MTTADGTLRLLDVGGTFVKTDDGRQVPIASAGTREEIAAALRQAVGQPETGRWAGIGIAVPGPFDYREGVFRMVHKFAAVHGCSFRELAGIGASVPLRFGHDVNLLLAGALRLQPLPGNTALVTLGTGLGFTYALNGQVQEGPTGSPARHLWNLPWRDGILEDVVSARGVRELYVGKGGDPALSAHGIARRAYEGEETAIEAYSDLGAVLGEALAPLVEELQIDTVLMAGQMSRSLSLMERPIANAIEGCALRPAPEKAVFAGLASLFEEQQ